MTAPDIDAIVKSLTEAQREALLDDERTDYQAIVLNAADLTHITVRKSAEGLLISMAHRLTPLGRQVQAHLKEQPHAD